VVQVLKGPNDAVKRFGLWGDNWLRPKPKTFFFAEFVLNSGTNHLVQTDVRSRMPLMVRTVDRPQFELQTDVHNQYNRSRVVHGKIKYRTVRVIYYDDVENTALKVFNEYRRFYYGDFKNKSSSTSWTYDTVGPGFEKSPEAQNWGLNTASILNGEQSYFFKQLNIFEFYNDQFTVFNLIHPKITSFDMDPREITDEAISETTIAIEYEGVTHQYDGIGNPGVDLINYPMTQEIANKIGIDFTADGGVRTSPPPSEDVSWTKEAQNNALTDILSSRNPIPTVVSTVASRILPPGFRNAQLPNTWDEAVRQASVLSGSKNTGTINKVTRAIRNIFG
jgi:hypothetical protein